MPIFEYKCNTCGEDFEKLLTKRDEEILCPRCGQKDVRKKFSVFGMRGVETSSGCSTCPGSTVTSPSRCSTCR